MSHDCHNYLGQGWFWSLTNWHRQGVKLQELWQRNVWNATTLGCLLDLYNYLEKFLCISTFLYFNANMSLTCIQKFLVILIMKQIWYQNCSDVLKSDLCNNLEKISCISPCLCSNADMSLTFKKKFLLIPIMNKSLISKQYFCTDD